MKEAAELSDDAAQDWERFKQHLQDVDYQKAAEVGFLQLLRYAYDAGWADGRAASKQQPAPSAPVVHEHDGVFHQHEGGRYFHVHYPGIPPGWEPAFLEG